MERLAVAAGVLILVALLVALRRRPPRRLHRLDLPDLGVAGPAIVQFSTPSCAPCKAAVPHLERTARHTEVAFAQVDLVDRPELARRYGIRTVPTIVVAGERGEVVGVWTAVPRDGEIARAAAGARTAR